MQILRYESIMIIQIKLVDMKGVLLNNPPLIILGKCVHDPSPIDEEIKKPLISETLQLVV